MKKRNKKYTPREVLADPVSWAVAGAYLMPTEKINLIQAPVDAAVLLLKQGRALRDDWNVVANALNLAEALAGLQVGHNLTAEIAAGQGALLGIARRMIGGSATWYAAELAAVDEAIFVYRAQMKVSTQGDFSRACERVKVLHRSGSMQDVADMFDLMPRAA